MALTIFLDHGLAKYVKISNKNWQIEELKESTKLIIDIYVGVKCYKNICEKCIVLQFFG